MNLEEKFKESSFFDKRVSMDIISVTKATEICGELIKDAIIEERRRWKVSVGETGRLFVQKINKLTDELILEITELQRLTEDITLTEQVRKLNVEGTVDKIFATEQEKKE